MFYAQLTKDIIQFAAFETEREAAEWIVDQLGSDYSEKVWVGEEGSLRLDSKFGFDFTAEVHASAEEAIVANARLDPGAAARVLRALCDAIEQAEEA